MGEEVQQFSWECKATTSAVHGGFVPSCMIDGRTALLQKKYRCEGNIASIYRSTACLSLIWKLLTGIIADKIYGLLDQQHLLPEEQKECTTGCRDPDYSMYIDGAVVYVHKRKLSMASTDCKKFI